VTHALSEQEELAALAAGWEPPPPKHGPYMNPVDRFALLPESTRRFLEELRDDDISEIREAIRFQRSAKTIGRFGKWMVITIVTAFIGAVTFGEKIAVAWRALFGGRGA
jgi:hypothetical protein